MQRSYRKVIAQDTLDILTSGQYKNQFGQVINFETLQQTAVKQTKLYQAKDSFAFLETAKKKAIVFDTTYTVINETTLNAVRDLLDKGEQNVFCLNFASAKNAGGGFLNGSQAQEESIARATGLYPCLLQAPEYYQTHRNQRTCLYSHLMIYSPNVPILKNEAGKLLNDIQLVSVVTSPAVNAGVVKRQEPKRVKEIPIIMKERIDRMLAIAYHHGHEVLVLGAWGCGVFGNEPIMIADLFYESLTTTFKGKFKHIVFAIKSKQERFRTPFEKLFM